MPEVPEKPVDSAEKAYAAAAAELKPAPVPESMPASEPAAAPEPATAAKAAAPEPASAKPVPVRPAAPKKAAAKSKTVRKAAKPASAPVPAKASKPAVPVAKAPPAKAPATVARKVMTTPTLTVTELKEKIMATAKTPDFSKPLADAFGDMQSKAKAAYEKGTEAVTEATEFTKGNVEALVESGKIFAGGVQDLGKGYAEEAKSAYETFTADIKEAAAVKSPTELFQLQGKIFRRNFDALVASSSKNTEAMIKLANDAFAPLSGRMNLAAEKLSKVA